MSSIDLFILGFIIERPMSAYDLAAYLKKNSLNEIIKISLPAIYKNLKKMYSAGYLDSKIIKQGVMPEKSIYSITDSGLEYFEKLMDDLASKNYSLHFEFNTFIAHIDKYNKPEAIILLDELILNLNRKKEKLEFLMNGLQDIPYQQKALLKQNYMVNYTLIKWSEDFKKEFANIG